MKTMATRQSGLTIRVMIREMFPSLFQFGVDSINFSDVVVSKSHINPDSCVIVKARKPIEWLLDHCANRGMDPCWISAVSIKRNTDGSISIIEK